MADPGISEGQRRLLALQEGGLNAGGLAAYKQQVTNTLQDGGMGADQIHTFWGDTPPSSPAAGRLAASNAAVVAGTQQTPSYQDAVLARADQGEKDMAEGRSQLGEIFKPSAPGEAPGPMDTLTNFASAGFKLSQGAWESLTAPAVGAVDKALAASPLAGDHPWFTFPVPYTDKTVNVGLHSTSFGDIASGVAALAVGALPGVARAARVAADESVEAGTMADHSEFPQAVAPEGKVTPGMARAMPQRGAFQAAVTSFVPPNASASARTTVFNNMRRVWVETGINPDVQVRIAAQDPALREELLGHDPHGQMVDAGWSQHALPDPKPLTPAPEGVSRPPEGQHALPTFLPSVDSSMGLLKQLEGSSDWSRSPVGAIGRYQIMPGTARMYGYGKGMDAPTLERWLHDPANNETVARVIVSDLYRKYHGNMDAIAIAYNAGKGRADRYLVAGPGTRLEAELDKTVRGGVRYTKVPAAHDEAFLPWETQKYLANARRRVGKLGPEEDAPGPQFERPDEQPIPSHDEAARPASMEDEPLEQPEGERMGGQSASAASVWEHATEEDLDKEILGNIGEQPKGDWAHLFNPDAWADATFAINPAKRLDAALSEAKLLKPDAEMGISDWFRETFASDKRAQFWYERGSLDGPGSYKINSEESLKGSVRAAIESGGTADGFKSYLLAARTVEKEGQGIETGISPFAAAEKFKRADQRAKYEKAAQMFNRVADRALDYAVAGGRYSPERAEVVKSMNSRYVSFRRIMGDDKSFTVSSGYGFNLGNPLKQMEGSDRKIVDPFLSTLDNIRLLVSAGDQNFARGRVIELAEKDPRVAAALGLRKIGNVKPSYDDVAEALAPYKDQMTPEEFEKMVDALTPVASARAEGQMGENEFGYYRNGELEKWHVASPEFARMMNGPGFSREEITIFERALEQVAALDRAGVLPNIVTRGILSHQITQWINSPMHPPPFLAPIKGLMHVLKADAIFEDAQAKGALIGGLTELDRDHVAETLRDMNMTGEVDTPWLERLGTIWKAEESGGRITNAFKAPLQAARWLQETGDNANRVGLKMIGEGRGLSPEKASMFARTGGIDYQERLASANVRRLSRIAPFWKAKLLYAQNGVDAFKRNPVDYVFYATAALSLPAAINWAINRAMDPMLPEDQRYDNIPRWQKDYGLVTPPINGQRMIVRYPEIAGPVFGAMVDRTLDAMLAHNPEAMAEWWKAFVDQLPIPDVAGAQPLIENQTNYSFMTGHQMTPDSLKGASPEMQFNENTTELGRKTSRYIAPLATAVGLEKQASPMAVDHLVQSILGSSGIELARLLNVPFGGANPPTDWMDNPFTRGLTLRNPGLNGQAVQDFYSEKARFDKALSDVQAARRNLRAGDTENDDMVSKETAMAKEDYYLNQVSAALSQQRYFIAGVNRSPMSDEEKRTRIESLTVQAIQIAKFYTAQMRSAQ